MRVLLLSQLYPPEPATPRHSLAQSLVERGHSVTAVTGFPNYPLGRIYPGYRQRMWAWDEIGGARVLRLPLFPDHSRSALRRAWCYSSFALSACFLGPILCGPADVMWVWHPPLTTAIPARWISLLRRVRFVYEIQDMWPETLAATGMVRSRLILSLVAGLGKLAYSSAAAIVVSSPGLKRNLIGKGVPEEKIHVIPNWVDESIYRPVPPDRAWAEEQGITGSFVVLFAGNMGLAQGLDTVLEAAGALSEIPEIQFVLIGDGVEERHLRREAEERGLRNVTFLGRRPAEDMPRFFAAADVLLAHLRRDPLFEITIPSKTQTYLACGRPILMAIAGDAAEVVRDAGAGLVCPPEDSSAMAEGIRTLVSMSREKREAMGRAGREAFLRLYRQSVLVDLYLGLFEKLARRRPK